MKQHIGIILITILGGALRFYGLGDKPLFIDESLFGLWVVEDGLVMQEFVPVLLGKLFGLDGEFQLRSISALFGTLSIPAMYLVCKDNKKTLASFIAFFPLFIFWSRMARPYAPAIFFLILSWYEYKQKWINVSMFVLALACTPISAIGVKITRKRLWVIPASIVAGLAFFVIRPDADREFLPMLEYSSRWWTIPATVFLLYIGQIKKSLWS